MITALLTPLVLFWNPRDFVKIVDIMVLWNLMAICIFLQLFGRRLIARLVFFIICIVFVLCHVLNIIFLFLGKL